MDRLRGMETFVAVAEAGSFASAAPLLGMTPQMVSKHIQALEERLGVRLIHRTTRRQSLTETGQKYYERCKFILTETASADAIASESLTEPSGTLKISAPYNFGSHSLMKFLASYLSENPRTAIELTLTDRYVNLTEEGYEAVFRVGDGGTDMNSHLVSRLLSPYQLILCASPLYLEHHGQPSHPDELAQHECLGYVYWDRITGRDWVFSREGVTYPVKINSRVRVNDINALMTAALEGFGIILAPEDILSDALEDGRLVRLLTDYKVPYRQLSLIYPSDRQQTAKLKSFISAVLRRFSSSTQ